MITFLDLNEKLKIGFIGQGFIGKNYADDFEERGYNVVRYAMEEAYIGNKDKIKDCDIVFIAVPTPTTPEGFDSSIVEDVISLVSDGKIAVIKSTIQPGTTERIAAKYPNKIIMHSPEFLRERHAAYDARNPDRNIIGITDEAHIKYAKYVLSVLPHAQYSNIMDARSAELVKYIGNTFLMTKVVFFNLMYDIARQINADWEKVLDAVVADKRIGSSHTQVLHESGHSNKRGRGAGGHCFIKDFVALRELYERLLKDDEKGVKLLKAIENKNIDLLKSSGKDMDLLEDVYGKI